MFGTSEANDVTPSHIVFLLMHNMLVGMKDPNVTYLINDLAACQDKKKLASSHLRVKFTKQEIVSQ